MEHNLYQQLILDHNKNPHNYGDLDPYSHKSEGYNPLCGDHLWIKLLLAEDKQTIEKIAFKGQCCAISKASASLMTKTMVGKTPAEVKTLFALFRELVLDQTPPEQLKSRLGKLIVFEGIKRYPSRIKCVLLAWYTVIAALEHQKTAESESQY
ncbi:iron-sulfur cluster assembly scaffold protein IscU [Spirochaetota bacterium]|nr:iron-sulfur cluster assembly scaffold protein IscU [Spirochaetota bacterium]